MINIMPSKKSKTNGLKAKSPSAPELTQAASSSSSGPVEAPTTTSASHAMPTLPPPNFSDDFWTKNARAKALIMSTLVPGSEAWNIAEPIELPSNIMRALEEKYAPKDANGRPLRGKDLAAWDKENRGKEQNTKSGVPPPSDVPAESYDDPTSSNFIGDFVSGRPMDKYLNVYKDKLEGSIASGQLKESPIATLKDLHKASIGSSLAHIAQTGRDELKPHPDLPPVTPFSQLQHPLQPSALSQPRYEVEADLPIPESFDLPPQPEASIPSTLLFLSSRGKRQPIEHDSYLSEYQATVFAQNDLDRKKQMQVAVSKSLMQNLPIRELRFLWAVLYGGENAPWPGSFSAVIPGVTNEEWGNMNYDLDYKTCVWSWNRKLEEKG